MSFSYTGTRHEAPRNHGVPGVLYILENQGLRAGFFKIGSTRRSGWSKAMELNRDIHNTIPGAFECVFELHTRDCGGALDTIYQELQYCRRGKKDQNYFELDLARAKQVVAEACATADRKLLSSYRAQLLEQRLRAEQEETVEAAADSIYSEAEAVQQAASAGVLKKAYRWMTGAASVSALAALVWGLSTWYGQDRLQAATDTAAHHSVQDASRAIQQGFSGGAADDSVAASPAPEMQAADFSGTDMATRRLARRLAALDQQERNALGLACLQQAKDGNADVFAACLERQLAKVVQRKPAVAEQLNPDEQSALEFACMGQKLNQGLSAYQACVAGQLAGFSVALRPAAWEQIAPARQKSIQDACVEEKYGNGPAAYDRCLSRHAEKSS